MKRMIAMALIAILCISMIAGCGGAEPPSNATTQPTPAAPTPAAPTPAAPTPAAPAPTDAGGDTPTPAGGTINLWSFTDEIPNAVKRYKEMNPDFPYDVNVTIIATTEGAYQPALDMALANGEVDIFAAEAAFVLKYTTGDASGYAMPYKDLGIDIDNKLSAAKIATYAHQLGTRASDGAVVGLPFQNTGSAVIYRRSLAIDTWGTDDPAVIKTKIGPGWDKFLSAAAELKAKGYSIVSGEGDVWQVVRNVADKSYLDNGSLFLDPKREAFLDIAKELYANEYTNRTNAWQDGWFADMAGAGPSPVFCFLGPAWLINYVMINNVADTFGDWAVTDAPVGFSWGGTWVIPANNGNAAVRDGVRKLIEWITLDTSDTGFQHFFANGNLYDGSVMFPDQAAAYAKGEFAKDAVASGVVMANADGSLPMLGGQNMYDYFIPAGANARGDFFSQYDETISQLFMDQVQLYINGSKSRDDAIKDFKSNVTDQLGIPH